ncbi:MAG: hypothetical protein EOP83_07915 [Verrucomicrobiaceae bacterium]|nr:MAG: hypothetical protein EOP83_07915 [Verrucomicrobiaceae bacterium]
MAEHCTVLPDEHRMDFHFFRVIGPRFSLSFNPLREWLDDPTRPGFYCWGQNWLASAGNLSPRDCIEVAITDPDVAFEFKLRWVG